MLFIFRGLVALFCVLSFPCEARPARLRAKGNSLQKEGYSLASQTLVIDSAVFNKGLFQRKLQESPPEWMLTQIHKDLSVLIDSGVSSEMLDQVSTIENLTRYELIRIRIQNGQVFCKTSRSIVDNLGYRLHPVLQALNTILQCTPFPDMDFVLSLGDSVSLDFPFEYPCFSFAKDKTARSILFPDCLALDGYSMMYREITEANLSHPWDRKREQMFWRGATTGGGITSENWFLYPRSKLVLQSLQFPDLIDARFNLVVQCSSEVPNMMKENGLLGSFVSPKDHLSYKYLIDVDGNTCTYPRCFWILLSNSILFKPTSPNIQWYYGALKPWKHYVPIQEDFSDLKEKIIWAKEHDAEAKKIADNGTLFASAQLSCENILLYVYLLLTQYAQLQKF